MVCVNLRSILLFTIYVSILCSLGVADLFDQLFISNLDPACFQCMCSTMGCNLTRGCEAGKCGPFHISFKYWQDGGQQAAYLFPLKSDVYRTPKNSQSSVIGYALCALEYNCSIRTIKGYLHRHARDCNSDGVTDCLDFIIMHLKGRNSCPVNMHESESDESVLEIYNQCDLFISNLDAACFQCMCNTMGCDRRRGCTQTNCGPFYISYAYWQDAGNHTIGQATPSYIAYQHCANDFTCSKRIIQSYIHRYGRDCNGDGVTNCLDFIMLHLNGRYGCPNPLNTSQYGQNVLNLYSQCILNV